MDKSLYMYEFHKQRKSIGTVEYNKVKNPLYESLYSVFKSVKETNVVKEVVEDIQDKIVDLSKKDEHILFPDVDISLQEVDETDTPIEVIESNPDDIKTITVTGVVPKEMKEPDDGRKKIVIDPNYTVGGDR